MKAFYIQSAPSEFHEVTMSRHHRATPAFILLALLFTQADIAADTSHLDEIIVTASKSAQPLRDISASASLLDSDTLSEIKHTHINEALQRVPGVWISRGNGQEHLTAIRSPVLTGAGSCGAFVMAQDGIPVRAPGFCNVNELFESASELASRIEVIRGPGSSIYGADALHGVINVLTPPVSPGFKRVSFEGGANHYYRSQLSLSGESLRIDATATSDGGYKDDSGFDQQKLVLRYDNQVGDTTFSTRLSYTNLNQETAGFISGHDAYKDSGRKRDNPNPEAYRDARSLKLSSEVAHPLGSGTLHITPYLRHVEMTFLQHFLPGQAVEENGHDSIGVMLNWQPDSWWQAGIELELTNGYLDEFQQAATPGSAFLQATIPAGQHYDYEVEAQLAGAYVSASYPAGDHLNINASLRYQYTRYDYDNRMLDGRTRDDGTTCGFGGCRFSRPADRQDSFRRMVAESGLCL